MKQNKIKILLSILLSIISIGANAQQTSLTIDNQMPGWLSSKISYGDQQTLTDLKITGYLNSDDLFFIANMSTKFALQVLDLEETHFVTGGSNDNSSSSFRITRDDHFGDFSKFKLRKIITSKYVSCSSNSEYSGIPITGADTLIVMRVERGYNVNSVSHAKKLVILPEGVEELRSSGATSTESMWIPSTIRTFFGYRIKGCNITSFIEDIENVVFKTDYIFDNQGYTLIAGDTLWIPKGTTEKYEETPFKNMKKIIEMAPPSEISLSNRKLKLYKNEIITLTSTILPNDTYFKGLIWKSTDENVISVSQKGEVRAMGYGKANVIVCSDKDKSIADTCEMEVYEHTTGISLSQTKVEVNIGETAELSAQTLPLGTSDNKITWNSSNTEIATVNSNGKVTALKLGVCTISATAQDGGSIAECVITVIQPAKSININKHSLSIRAGSFEELQAIVSPDNTTYKEVEWTSSKPEIAEVSERGIVTAKKAGKTYITVISQYNPQVKDSCEVTVLQPVTGITLDKTSITFEEIGKTVQLSATVLPDDASDKALRWTSSNPSVCIVSERGIVVAVGTGTSVVSVTTVDGGFVAVCVVTVSETNGIINIEVDTLTGNEQIYDVHGKRIRSLQKGVNIIRMNDGTIKKVMVK